MDILLFVLVIWGFPFPEFRWTIYIAGGPFDGRGHSRGFSWQAGRHLIQVAEVSSWAMYDGTVELAERGR